MKKDVVQEQTAPPRTDSDVLLCPQCRRETLARRHCKLICYACGYVESCEDNFVITAEVPPTT